MTISWIDENIEELSYIVDGDEKWYIYPGKQFSNFLKLNIYLSNDQEIPLYVFTQENEDICLQKTCM